MKRQHRAPDNQTNLYMKRAEEIREMNRIHQQLNRIRPIINVGTVGHVDHCKSLINDLLR